MPIKITSLSRLISALGLMVLAVIPFHAFLTVWFSTFLGHYTALRLWKEMFLLVMVVAGLLLLVKSQEVRARLRQPLVLLTLGYIGFLVVWAVATLLIGDVSTKAVLYGLVSDSRYIVFFLVILLCVGKNEWFARHWIQLILWPAIVVSAFAIVQYTLLPHDFLGHFGYNKYTTIPPAEVIDNDPRFPRVQSTLRGANPLGAYLVVTIAVSAALLVRQKARRRLAVVSMALGVLALYFSFSRSAWLGCIAALALVCIVAIRSPKLRRWLLVGAVVGAILLSAGYSALKNNREVQNTVLHNSAHHASPQTSNGGHLDGLKRGMHDLAHQPLGGGIGSAGPASQYNAHALPRIAEDYFIQIGQETGWIGLILFVALNGMLAFKLYLLRREPLALALLASLAGLWIVNLLSHAWADDTLAYLWWGLAGFVLAAQTKDHA